MSVCVRACVHMRVRVRVRVRVSACVCVCARVREYACLLLERSDLAFLKHDLR